jgi:hypothetical protein
MKRLLLLSVIGGIMISSSCKKDEESKIEGEWEVQSYEEKSEPQNPDSNATYSSYSYVMTNGTFILNFKTDPDRVSASGTMMVKFDNYNIVNGDTVTSTMSTIEYKSLFEQEINWNISSEGTIQLGSGENTVNANYALSGDNLRIWFNLSSSNNGLTIINSTDISLRRAK